VTNALGVRSEELKIHNDIKSIAIGSFDGIHVAHQALIARAEAVVVIERNGGYLTPGYKRTWYVDKPVCFYHFEKIKDLTPEAFVEKIEEDFPALEKIVVGYDFSFGKERMGNGSVLTDLFHEEVEIVSEICYDGVPVRSRTIRFFLKEGNIKMVNALLGRRYVIDGEVVAGQGLGARSLVPTLNLKVMHYQLPKEGVYATRTNIHGIWYDSVSFIGHRVTTDGSFAVESYVIDKDIGKVSGRVCLAFVAHIRDNIKFDTLEALKVQITNDITCAKEVLEEEK
jgi:riboflavin kinase/FMN adenylyltransferase